VAKNILEIDKVFFWNERSFSIRYAIRDLEVPVVHSPEYDVHTLTTFVVTDSEDVESG